MSTLQLVILKNIFNNLDKSVFLFKQWNRMEVGKKPYNASKGIIFQLMVKLNFEQVFGSLFQVHGALTTVSWHKLLSLVKWWYNTCYTVPSRRSFEALYGYSPPPFLGDPLTESTVDDVAIFFK